MPFDVSLLLTGIVSAVDTVVALICFFGLSRLLQRWFYKTNFRGARIPNSAGLVFGVSCLQFFDSYDDIYREFAIAAIGFMLLGLVDDLFGDRSAGGFRGHFRKLLREKTLTTGVIKVIGGGLLSLYVSWKLTVGIDDIWLRGFTVLGSALLIALSANTSNLIDLRPGRCLFASIIAALIGIAAAEAFPHYKVESALVYTVVSAAIIYIPDRFGKLMIGDAGSNAFGAALGVAYTQLLPLWGIWLAVAALIAFQIWCEKHSLSKFIESKPLLRSLDRKIGVRG